MRQFIRRKLIETAIFFEHLSKQLYGAADKVVPEKKLFLYDLEQQNWESIRPCFVLSTGRCGTELLNRLFLLSPDADTHHEPTPELVRASKRAYEELSHAPEIFREVFKSAREEYLLKSARQDKIYIETNNKVTFFAPIIRDVFPKTIFIHLVRHPGSFVRSGIRRKWYTTDHSHDAGRIVPLSGEWKKRWATMSPIEKNGWLWNETNQYIENYLRTLTPDNYIFVKAEDLFQNPDETKRIFEFIGLSGYSPKKVEKIISKPVNAQKKGQFPPYREWPDSDKAALKRVAPLADKYGYQL
jgi:hypothetical protein